MEEFLVTPVTSLGSSMFITQALIMTFFTVGYVSLYTRLWHWTVRYSRQAHRQWLRAIPPLIVIAAALLLLVTANGYQLRYFNVALTSLAGFMLVFTVFDAQAGWSGFAIRAFGVGLFWVLCFAGFPNRGLTAVVTAGLVVWLIVIGRQHDQIRYRVGAQILAFMSIICLFWLGISDQHLTLTMRIEALSLSMLSVLVSGYYLYRIHQDSVASAANARQATIDALTGAHTFAKFEADMQTHFVQAQAKRQPLALIAMDVDYFKAINDYYGHPIGNVILTEVAHRLQEVIDQQNPGKILYRTGGEEFDIIATDMTADDCLTLARGCWQAIRERPFVAGDYQIDCSLSCGIAGIHVGDARVDDVYTRADKNLYQSKQRGRDTITLHGQPVVDMKPERAMDTYTFFTQRIVDLDDHLKVVANDILLGHYQRDQDRWQVYKAALPVVNQMPFMRAVARMNPDERLSISISSAEFEDQQVLAQLIAFMHEADHPMLLLVTVQGAVSLATVKKMMPQYHAVDIRVILVINDFQQAQQQLLPMLDDIDGVRVTLPVLKAAFVDQQSAQQAMSDWYWQCRLAHVDVIFVGIENSVDADYVRQVLHGHYVQGYVFDQPELPRMA